MGDRLRAELYLRLLAERTLLDAEIRHPFGGPVLSAADALRAVDAIPSELAEEIVNDFDLARALRHGGGRPARLWAAGRSGPAADLKTIRAVVCKGEVALSGWQAKVMYVLLSPDSTVVGITATETAPAKRGHVNHPIQASLSDDRGNTTTGGFSGGSGGGQLDGVLTASRPLEPSTQWITVGSTRIELSDSGFEPPPVAVEKLPPTDPALGYLWRRLATVTRPMAHDPLDLDAAIDALVYVGAIDDTDDQITHLRTAEETFGGRFHRMGPGLKLPAHPPTGLPDPWASLAASISRPPRQGPTGLVPVGVVTPPVDGTVIVVEVLTSDPEGFTIRIAISPGTAMHPGAHPAATLAWWAEDDAGHVYLGSPSQWNGNSDLYHGTLQFWPPLDPRCRQLKFMPTGETERAVIPIALEWSSAE